MKKITETTEPTTYRAQSARDAMRLYSKSYCDYLEEAAKDGYDYFMRKGQPEKAQLMLTRSLSEALIGNEGE